MKLFLIKASLFTCAVLLCNNFSFGQSEKDQKKNVVTSEKGMPFRINSGKPRPTPLFILVTPEKEIIFDTATFKSLSPKWIKSIDILKGAAATERFGTPGENGVILIKLKEENLSEFLKLTVNNSKV